MSFDYKLIRSYQNMHMQEVTELSKLGDLV